MKNKDAKMIILDTREEEADRTFFKDIERGETFEFVYDDFHVCMRIDIDKAVVLDTGEMISVDLNEPIIKQDCVVMVY
jgi:hypothetical protein